MDINGSEVTTNSSTQTRSVFYCPIAPEYIWDLNNTIFIWILIILRLVASPVAILLNTFAIMVLKRRGVLQRNSNVLLASMAVTGILMGAVNMPLSATVDVIILRQVPFEHICFLATVPEPATVYFLTFAFLYHLTAIAWERYVAIVKWIDYKVIVTRSRLQKLAVIAWLGSLFTVLPGFIARLAGGNIEIMEGFLTGLTVFLTSALIAITYFYIMVYLGVRKRNVSEISQVTALVQAKLESKVAKTTVILTVAVIFSNVPSVVLFFLGEAFPFLRKSVSFRFWELLFQLNSIVNPLLYCYRDRRFRNAFLELLRIKKPKASQPKVVSVRYVRRKDPFDAVEDVLGQKSEDVAKHDVRLMRTASCELAVVQGQSNIAKLKRSTSAPTLQECRSWGPFNDFQQKQSSSMEEKSTTIYAESGRRRDKMKKTKPELPKDANLSQGTCTAKLVCNISRSKSFRATGTYVSFVKKCPDMEDTMLKRPRSAPQCMPQPQ